MKRFFHALLAGCLAVGFQSACCGAVLCIGIEGHVSIEMTCRTLAFLQQNCSNSFPLRSAGLSDQDGGSGCGQCVDIPIQGIPDGVRIESSAPTLLLPPVHYASTLIPDYSGYDEGNAANCHAALFSPNHSISVLRTTVLLI